MAKLQLLVIIVTFEWNIVENYESTLASLKEVPDDIPWNTTLVNLTANGINSTDGKFQNLTLLNYIRLDYNKFETFPNLSYVGNTLTHLNLVCNKISYVDPDLVGFLNVLTTLHLEQNQLKAFPDVASTSSTLSKFLFHENPFVNFSNQHEIMDALSSISETNLAKCHFPDVPLLGRMCSKLKILDFKYNFIASVNPIAFEHCSLVTSLDASHNYIQIFPNLTYLGDSLQTLILINNSLQDVNPYVLDPLLKLSGLHLSLNNLTAFPDIKKLGGSLESLSLDRNRISVISAGCLLNLTKLQTLIMHTNRLTHFPDINGTFCSLKTLDLSNNQLKALPSFKHIGLNMITLKLGSNPDIEITDRYFFKYMPNLKYVRLSGTNLTIIPDLDYVELITAYFSKNSAPTPIHQISARNAALLGNIKTVYLESSQLTEMTTACVAENSVLYMTGNPRLHLCSCKMAWVKHLIMNHPERVHVDDVQCKSGFMWSQTSLEDILASCNISVFPGCVKSQFYDRSRTYPSCAHPLTLIKNPSTLTECMHLCAGTPECQSFNFILKDSTYGICGIVSPSVSNSNLNQDDLNELLNSGVYHMTFDKTTWCPGS